MKIPQQLNQFEKHPVLFIVAGDYGANFFLTHKGKIEEGEELRFSMRDDAREKQAYSHGNPSPEKMGAVSHFGPYKEDLKEKFYKAIGEYVSTIVYDKKIEEIYLFAPSQSINRIDPVLKKQAADKMKGKFVGEYINHSPIQIIKIWEEKHCIKIPPIYYTEEERKILKNPKTKKN